MGEWRERMRVDPRVCHGKACIRGTRVLVSVVLNNIAAGIPREEILASYPALDNADIDCALAYAAELAREGTADLPLEVGVSPSRSTWLAALSFWKTGYHMKPSYTELQGQYLAFMAAYTKLIVRPPAEADIQRYFKVSPPTVHRMILTLDKRGLIARRPGQARSIEVLVPREKLPPLD